LHWGECGNSRSFRRQHRRKPVRRLPRRCQMIRFLSLPAGGEEKSRLIKPYQAKKYPGPPLSNIIRPSFGPAFESPKRTIPPAGNGGRSPGACRMHTANLHFPGAVLHLAGPAARSPLTPRNLHQHHERRP
jgi:hypothetical protein